jgi:nitroreductase
MDALTALHTRKASPKLVEPVPTDDELTLIYQAALRAPDHGMLRPWRFLVVKGEARNKLGELFVAAMQPDTKEKRNKLLNAPLRAPMIIIAVTTITEHPKVPAIEQITSTAAAVQNMSLAAHALGYASIWRTGAVASSDEVKLGLDLNVSDEIVGFLYLGSSTYENLPIPVVNIKDHFKDWS